MQLTQHTDFGLRLLIVLARRGSVPVSLPEFAAEQRLSYNHVAKVAQQARHAAELGLAAAEPQPDMAKVTAFIQGVIARARPDVCSALTMVSTSVRPRNCTGERLTATLSPAGQAAASRQAW